MDLTTGRVAVKIKNVMKNNLIHTKYKNIFSDVWKFMNDLYPPDNTPDYWETCHEQGRQLVLKYKGTGQESFVLEMVLNVIDELEKTCKKSD